MCLEVKRKIRLEECKRQVCRHNDSDLVSSLPVLAKDKSIIEDVLEVCVQNDLHNGSDIYEKSLTLTENKQFPFHCD